MNGTSFVKCRVARAFPPSLPLFLAVLPPTPARPCQAARRPCDEGDEEGLRGYYVSYLLCDSVAAAEEGEGRRSVLMEHYTPLHSERNCGNWRQEQREIII